MDFSAWHTVVTKCLPQVFSPFDIAISSWSYWIFSGEDECPGAPDEWKHMATCGCFKYHEEPQKNMYVCTCTSGPGILKRAALVYIELLDKNEERLIHNFLVDFL